MNTSSSFDDHLRHDWGNYQRYLCSALRRLEGHETLVAAQSADEVPDRPHGRITFSVTGNDRVRATISGTDLAAFTNMSDDPSARLAQMGWRRLKNGNHIVEAARKRPQRVAMLASVAFRQIWDVLHPVFLTPLADAVTEPTADKRVAAVRSAPVRHENLVLLARVAEMLTAAMGAPYTVSSVDDSIMLPDVAGPNGEVFTSRLHVSRTDPTLECVARLAPLTDIALLGQIIAEYGSHWRGISFHLDGGHLYALRVIDCAAFHPDNLRCGLKQWKEFLSEAAGDIVERVAAALPPPHKCANTGVPDGLRALIAEAQDGTLSSKAVADLCDLNIHLILDYLRVCDEQIVDWTEMACSAALQNAGADYKNLMSEVGCWNETSELLRGALRYAVITNHHKRQGPIAS